ncbi:15-hydroxyprostaglandin dehydrogenase [NAD(+)]-like [Nylanderia fulva]|uniref:15-hydroxyprostaglandin dehydrogenase [NAD(+)]-like n=1 Tax=Nylanderia fulva TaxID=613905 RepID=UPI0010FAD5C1|nr:15-hydroxyprostaglandin dehydrogenase [NAD(+)]-like [Nylanderia fulva]
MDVWNRTAMVTGGAAGMGYKHAEILLQNGAKSVAIIDLPTSNGENAATTLEKEFGKGRAVFIACDVSKAKDLEKAFKKVIDTFEILDIVINNAAIMNEHKWEQTINVNITGLIRNSFLALDHMGRHKGGKGGVIVNIASRVALGKFPPAPVYVATKHAVLGFSQSLAGLYKKTGVRVLVMVPGTTKTPILNDFKSRVISIIDDEWAKDEYDNFELNVHQPPDYVAVGVLAIIQKGENGAVWLCENKQPPCVVDFPHYSKRISPVES